MTTTLKLGDIIIDVVRKDIKNVHLSVYPPSGAVRLAAPTRMAPETLRVFAVSKLGWIKQQRRKFREQEREAPREYIDRESHYVWGKRYLLRIIERDAAPQVTLTPSRLILQIRPGTPRDKRHDILEAWYRQQIHATAPALIKKWSRQLRVAPPRYFVQRMKTKWGSCSRHGNIRLNTELAKRPSESLEYIIAHELTHLLESSHNPRFVRLLDHHLPHWRSRRNALNRLPLI